VFHHIIICDRSRFYVLHISYRYHQIIYLSYYLFMCFIRSLSATSPFWCASTLQNNIHLLVLYDNTPIAAKKAPHKTTSSSVNTLINLLIQLDYTMRRLILQLLVLPEVKPCPASQFYTLRLARHQLIYILRINVQWLNKQKDCSKNRLVLLH
jgi:hypothetical protein